MKIQVLIELPDDRPELLEPEADGTFIVDECFLKRWSEDDSFFVFERGEV